MASNGIYDDRGRIIKSTINRIEGNNEPVSADKEATSTTTNTIAQSVSGSSSTIGYYHGNILMRDNSGKVAIFIGLE